jgi:WD40 repeat protein
MATCDIDKTVRVWNYLTNNLEIVTEFTENVYSVSIHPDRFSMLIGFGDKLRLCSVFYEDIKPIQELPIHVCRCVKFWVSDHLFAAVNGSKIPVYSSVTFQLVNTLHGQSAGVQNLASVGQVILPIQHTQLIMSNNGQRLFSTTKDGKVYSLGLPIGGDKLSVNCHPGAVTSIAISFDDSLLFTTGEDGMLCIFHIHNKDN